MLPRMRGASENLFRCGKFTCLWVDFLVLKLPFVCLWVDFLVLKLPVVCLWVNFLVLKLPVVCLWVDFLVLKLPVVCLWVDFLILKLPVVCLQVFFNVSYSLSGGFNFIFSCRSTVRSLPPELKCTFSFCMINIMIFPFNNLWQLF